MNKPQRSVDFLTDEAMAVGTAIASADSALGRMARRAVDQFEVAAKFKEPASSNGTLLATKSEPDKIIGADLRQVAQAPYFLDMSLLNAKSPKLRPMTFAPLQEWEGYVVGVSGDHMIANLVDLTARETRPSSTVEIPLEELELADIERLRPGMIFRWAIGYLRTPSGTKKRISNIVFRDLPQWTKRELNDAKKRATEMAKYFASGDDKPNIP